MNQGYNTTGTTVSRRAIEAMTVAELKHFCKRNRVKGYSMCLKSELVDIVYTMKTSLAENKKNTEKIKNTQNTETVETIENTTCDICYDTTHSIINICPCSIKICTKCVYKLKKYKNCPQCNYTILTYFKNNRTMLSEQQKKLQRYIKNK
jgi:hypothetical protein